MADNTLLTSALAAVMQAETLLRKLLEPTGKKPVGINVAGAPWYAPRQTLKNIAQSGQWSDSKWTNLTGDKLDRLGYPKDWSQSYNRLLGTPTGGWVRDTSVIVRWKGSGNLTFNGSVTNMVRGDHTMSFTIPAWGGAVRNRWFTISGVDAADPFRELEVVDADPTNATDHQFSKEIVETLSIYHTLRFMDWNGTNNSPEHSLENRPLPNSLDRPYEAIENMVALCNLTNCNIWYCLSWRAKPEYNAWVAKYVRDNLNPWLKAYFENSNEVWNYQFMQAQWCLQEAIDLKLNTNSGYGHWQNYSRRFILAVDPWERAFADRPGQLVRVLGTQVAYPEVTRQALKWPGILDHIDAIAGAPYFSHDRSKPYTDALLRANIADTVQTLIVTRDIARAVKPDILCFTYEGGQHELPSAAGLTLEQFTTLQRSQFMGTLYTEYLTALTKVTDLAMLYYDVGDISKFGAWGQREYGGQTDAPKQIAVDNFLKN